MTTNDELINKGKKYIQTNWISLVVVFIALCLILIIGITFGKYHPDPNSALIKELIDKKVAEEKLQYEQIIKTKEGEIISIQSQLNASSILNSSYIKSIIELNNQMKKIQKPKDINETKRRLKELGYETK
jgi:predicted RND superfamily exporter protein